MKKYLLILLTCFIFCCASAQEHKYFDVDHKEISKTTFEEKRATNTVLSITGDSIHHHQLINREEKGKINDKAQLVSLLERASNRKIDTLKSIVIIYYPGQDSCNSTGNPKMLIEANKTLKSDLHRQLKLEPIYIYKTATGLSKFEGAINWIKDPEQTIERHFFKYHYPCGSFVVISKNGDYMSYFGEYPGSYIVETAKKLSK